MKSIMTVEQLKMARAALNWSVTRLASESGVGARTIHRVETEGGLAKATSANLKLIRETLEAAGVEFIGSPEDGPGVRLWRK